MWALALGTPVLVVAGFGHLISLFLKSMYKKAKRKQRTHSESQSISPSEKVAASSRSVPLPSSSPPTSLPFFQALTSFPSTVPPPLRCLLRVRHHSLHLDETDGSARNSSSIKPRAEQVSRRPSMTETENVGDRFYFELDVGGNPGAVQHWPSFIRMNEGRALLRAVLLRENELDSDLETGVTGPHRR